jgi:CRP/FNR family transcriptional regulator, cyclic AMP receptor protein
MHWAARAGQVGAQPADPVAGTAALALLWAGGRGAFDAAALQRLAGHLHFVTVPAGRRVILQDEPGDFMLIVLEGSITVERIAGGPKVARLAEARPGDVLGEMALLDAGPRASDCTTRTPCTLAVLETDALARLMHDDPQLALVLMAALARRLSLRLRQVSTRLSALLSDG